MVFELCRVTNIIFGGIFKNSCISLTRFGGNKYLTALPELDIVCTKQDMHIIIYLYIITFDYMYSSSSSIGCQRM